MVAKLLIQNGANVNDRRVNGGTPLYMSAYFGKFAFWILLENDTRFLLGQARVARLLIDNGARVHVQDKRYRTPIVLPSTQEGIFQRTNVFYVLQFLTEFSWIWSDREDVANLLDANKALVYVKDPDAPIMYTTYAGLLLTHY